MPPIPLPLWRTLEEAGWPRHCRALLRPGKTHALHFAIDHGLPETVWRPLMETGVGLREVIRREGHMLTPLLLAAKRGEPTIALALIEGGVGPGSLGYRDHEKLIGTVWFGGFNAPEKRADYMRLLFSLVDSGKQPLFFNFNHIPDYLKASHRQAIEEVRMVIGQRKQAGTERERLEQQLPESRKAMGQGRL
jgi:hypothetical protein